VGALDELLVELEDAAVPGVGIFFLIAPGASGCHRWLLAIEV
jgi:hypothetical protein